MIPAIGIYDAKNKLSELLDRVENGETIAITRHGEQVALLTPVHPQQHSSPAGNRAAAQSSGGERRLVG